MFIVVSFQISSCVWQCAAPPRWDKSILLIASKIFWGLHGFSRTCVLESLSDKWCAVKKSTFKSGRVCLNLDITARPSMSGSLKSVSTISKLCLRNVSNASLPLIATSESNPQSWKYSLNTKAVSRLSSIIRIFFFIKIVRGFKFKGKERWKHIRKTKWLHVPWHLYWIKTKLLAFFLSVSLFGFPLLHHPWFRFLQSHRDRYFFPIPISRCLNPHHSRKFHLFFFYA